jgi:ATP-dependent DNA helicase DinG
MEDIFGKDGLIAQFHPDFEFRPGQWPWRAPCQTPCPPGVTFLLRLGQALEKRSPYLVPAVSTGRRVIISTGTKNLQEQLFLQGHPVPPINLSGRFRASYLKGDQTISVSIGSKRRSQPRSLMALKKSITSSK